MSHLVNSTMFCCAAVTIIASAPIQGHARSKQNKHDHGERYLKSVSNMSNFSFKSARNEDSGVPNTCKKHNIDSILMLTALYTSHVTH